MMIENESFVKMIRRRSLFFLVLLGFAQTGRGAGGGEWNKGRAGPSKYYKELDTDNLIKYTNLPDKDTVLVLYGDQCSHCQELHPEQEKAAKATLEETNDIFFARYDVYRNGSFNTLHSNLEKNLPGWQKDWIEGANDMYIPSAYFFKREGDASGRRVFRIDHGDIGWGPKGGDKQGCRSDRSDRQPW